MDDYLEHLHTLDISLPQPALADEASSNIWDDDIAGMLSLLPSLRHFAARHTPAGAFRVHSGLAPLLRSYILPAKWLCCRCPLLACTRQN